MSQSFKNQSVQLNELYHTQFGSSMDFKCSAVIIPCVQGLRGGNSTLIRDPSELEELGLNDDIEIDFGTTQAPKKLVVPNAVKAFVESFFAQRPGASLMLIRGCPKGGGFVTVNPAGQVDHDVIIDIAGTEYKVTTKGTSTIKDEAGVGGALVTAAGTAEGVKDQVTFTSVTADGPKHTSLVDKSGSEKFNWFINMEKSKNIKPVNHLATLDDTKVDKILDYIEENTESFYLFSVIASYAPVKDPKKATFWKPYDPVMKWVELRDGQTKQPKVYVQDVPQELVLESTWGEESKAKIESGLHSRTVWVSNPEYRYDNAAAKILARHAETEYPGSRPFLRMRVRMSYTYSPTKNKLKSYEKYNAIRLGYFGSIDKQNYGYNGGRTMTGEQLQHLVANDVIKELLRAELMASLYKTPSIQFNDIELALLRSNLEQVLRLQQSYSVIAPEDQELGPSYIVSVPKSAAIPMTEKRQAILRNVCVTIRLSGGIEKIILTFNSVR